MMDERPSSPATHDRNVSKPLHLSNGPSFRRSSNPRSPDGNVSIPFQYSSFHHYTTLTIVKDSKGYGMKVSGDNPVYVQSVKEGGAAEKAGLHSGDKIIKVNGTDVTQSTHTEVVELIKSYIEVELTVQKRITQRSRPPTASPNLSNCAMNNRCSSPMSPPTSPNQSNTNSPLPTVTRPLHHHHSAPARDRITAPQPVDHEKLRQFESQRVQTFRLMLEKEQRYADALRSELAKCSSDSSNEQQISRDLSGANRRIRTIQEQLEAMTSNNNSTTSSISNGLYDEQLFPTPPPPPPVSTLPTRIAAQLSLSNCSSSFNNSSLNNINSSSPPPLPSRNRNVTSPVLGNPPSFTSPPPLPPRQYPLSPITNVDGNEDACQPSDRNTLPNSPVPIHHQRTKSNPDRINNASMSLPSEDNLEKSITTESLDYLNFVKRSKGGVSWNVMDSPLAYTPPGTPPPPYHCKTRDQKEHTSPPASMLPSSDAQISGCDDDESTFSPNSTQSEGNPSATIISMEDEDMFDQEPSNLRDHGPFKSIIKLWEHCAHLAVFLNYVLSNCDPSSILFYLITDLYKEGNGKEMRKWAYEIHSSFLGPGAPLRLSNVDENIAREIDDVLVNESDKEEILRKVFWKARSKAKEELNDQLADFQQKRTAGLGPMFGPADAVLDECIHDKSKESATIEQILLPRLKEYITDDTDREQIDDRKFTTAAALGTILSKIFGLRGQNFNSLLERCPTFVSKEKSFKARLIGRSRKVTMKGHHFNAHQYFTVTYCNHCQLIIRGIGPQGYQCSNCLLNIHRACVKILDENCLGPLVKKDKTNDNRISKLMDKIRPERNDTKRKPSSSNFSQLDKIRKQAEEQDASSTDNEFGEKVSCGGKSKSSNVGHGAVDTLKELDDKLASKQLIDSENNFIRDLDNASNLSLRYKSSGTSINRSESYKERIYQKKQIRERRKTSDPNLSKTNADVEVDSNNHFPYPATNSESSSNSNLSSRSLDSPSNSLEVVGSNNKGSCETTTAAAAAANAVQFNNSKQPIWDSDSDTEVDPPDSFKHLSPIEKKRQEVINELFQTERSHIRVLKVLDKLFYQPMKEQQILPSDYLELLFPNLEEMLIIHSQFNSNLKSNKKENYIFGNIGDTLLKTFDGSEGKLFEKAAAVFCCRQKVALEKFKEKRSKKDSPLHNFLREAESNPLCRRLQLQDIVPTEMQRLTKYPLLFENLARYSKNNSDEESLVCRAVERSKEIVNRINEAIKEAADQDQMVEIQRKLDKSAFDKIDHPMSAEVKNLDITKRKVIYHGNLTLRLPNSKQKSIELYVLLLEELVILLQKLHDKYHLQFFSNSGPSDRTSLCPVIKVTSNLIVRRNAVDKKALYLLDRAQYANQMYDLVAPSENEKEEWFERLSNSAEAHKTKDHKQKSSDRSSDVSILDHCENDAESSAKTKENESNDSSETVSSTTPSANVRHPQDELTHRTSIDAVSKKTDSTSPSSHKKQPLLTVEPPPRITTEVPLIEPSQVLISQSPVLTAEPVLTPLERLRRKDEVIREALKEKQKLVADILHVSTTKSGGSGGGGGECEAVTNFQSEVTYDKEASELVLAAVSQADQLTGILNECLRVSEEDVIIAGSETTSKMSSNATIATTATATTTTTTTTSSGGGSMRLLPSLQVPKLQSITHSLSAHLTQLLNITIERDEEREKLRQELQKSREQLHAVYETQLRSQQRLGDQLPSPDQPTRNSTNDNQLDVTSKTSANDCSSAKK